jgi:hypothetical protein
MSQAMKAEELKDLDVERIDGVDRPATGRKFVLFKSASEASRVLGQAVRKSVSFVDVVLGRSAVQKGVKEYMPGDKGIKADATSRVGAALGAWSGKTTDATREPRHPSTSGFDRHGAVKMGPNYAIADPWLRGDLHSDPGFSEGEGSGIVEPANFKPTGTAPLNLGEGLQFSKSALEWAYADAVKAGETELADTIAKKLKSAGVDVKKSVDKVQWVYGPSKWNRGR